MNIFFKYACHKCPKCNCMERYLKHLEKMRYFVSYSDLKLELGIESNAAQSHRVIGLNPLGLRRYDYSNRNFTGWKAA